MNKCEDGRNIGNNEAFRKGEESDMQGWDKILWEYPV